MRVYVVGNRGQLGTELMRGAWPSGWSVTGADLPELDLTNGAQLEQAITASAPDVIVNASAYTAVDKAETERELAQRVNAEGPAHLARLASARGATIFHVSTDYVFDGAKIGAYVEDDPIAPLGVYGATKAAGESAVREAAKNHVILRTSWVYAAHGANFVKTMIRLAKERDVLSVVGDQHGRPTAARELARGIIAIAQKPTWGTFHFAGAGETTWHGLASEVIARAEKHLGKRPEVRAITTRDYPTPARRPANSVLDTTKVERTFGLKMTPWQTSVAQVVDELFQETKS